MSLSFASGDLRPLLLTFALFGCGAQVVFDGESSGGSGQGGSTSAQGASSQGGTTSSSPGPGPGSGGSTSTGPGDLCQQLCTQFPECIGGGVDCIASCDQIFVPGCETQAADLLSCAIANLKPGGNCELPPGLCDAQGLAYSECTNGSKCTSEACSIGNAVCSCDGNCGGVTVTESCHFGGGPSPGGPPPQNVFCDCFANGTFIGSCSQDILECSLESGCCQALL